MAHGNYKNLGQGFHLEYIPQPAKSGMCKQCQYCGETGICVRRKIDLRAYGYDMYEECNKFAPKAKQKKTATDNKTKNKVNKNKKKDKEKTKNKESTNIEIYKLETNNDMASSTKNIGKNCKIVLLDQSTNKEVTYYLVGDGEANIDLNKISLSSPLGKALAGRNSNSIIKVSVPDGTMTMKVLSWENMLR